MRLSHLSLNILLCGSAAFATLSTSGKAFAIGDQLGVTRIFNAGDSPIPFSFFDFKGNSFKAECVSGGSMVGLSVPMGGTPAPHAIRCQNITSSTVIAPSPIEFLQTNPESSSEKDEFFSMSDSADVGHHGTFGTHGGDWDFGFRKGECPVLSVATGIDQGTSGGQVDALHCADPAGAMCLKDGANLRSNTTCHVVTLPSGGNSYGQWDAGNNMDTCAAHEAVVGVSVYTTNQHPHALLCCQVTGSIC